MKHFFLSYLFVISATVAGLAQVQWNPYVGLITGDRTVALVQPTNELFFYEGNRLQLGIDVLFGAGQLAPLVGLSYRMSSYESEQAASFDYGHVRLPLGVAYRFLAADFDINLVLLAAIAPGLALGDDRTEAGNLDTGLDWSGRGGATLYLGTITLGLQYGLRLSDTVFSYGRKDDFTLTLGARF